MQYGYIKAAAGTPSIQVGNCTHNAEEIIHLVLRAHAQGVKILALPELCLTGYTCADLFLQDTLLTAAKAALKRILDETKAVDILFAVGMPLRIGAKRYNCAAVLHRGRVLGVIPKKHLPNYNEFYEARQFTPAPEHTALIKLFDDQEIPFGPNILFACDTVPGLVIGAEICEDVWVAAPPSTTLTALGATVILNLSASSEVVGKAEYRRMLLQSHSARTCCGYLYADAGWGESTTDLVFAGHDLVVENGTILAECKPFEADTALAISEIDIQHLLHERGRQNTYEDAFANTAHTVVSFAFAPERTALTRPISALPFIPAMQEACAARCEEILQIQAQGLRKRLHHIGNPKVVLGISGGLDSTLALLVCVRTMAIMRQSNACIQAVTMPCFGTTKRTRSNAQLLCERLGVPCKTVDISAAVTQHFIDIAHPEGQYDTTYENAQARERTQVLMDIANQTGGIVIGTGDLSELALGWATYNGDHMSMYALNASVPKTLVRQLVAYVAAKHEGEALSTVLYDILDTPVSPELLPVGEQGEIAQQTEQLVGPYELHDFFLYHMLRWGEPPQKIKMLAQYAFKGKYDDFTITQWLTTFYKRFFMQQFKRSCMPDGPKIGSVSLSPRGDWRMPSDAVGKAWIDALRS